MLFKHISYVTHFTYHHDINQFLIDVKPPLDQMFYWSKTVIRKNIFTILDPSLCFELEVETLETRRLNNRVESFTINSCVLECLLILLGIEESQRLVLP